MKVHPSCRWGVAFVLAALTASVAAVQPTEPVGLLASREFSAPELYLNTSNAPLQDVLKELPNRAAWERELTRQAGQGDPLVAFFEPRTGKLTNWLLHLPLVPGTGLGNRLTTATLAQALGRPVEAIDAPTVIELVSRFATHHADLIGIDPAQLGPGRAVQVTADLWHVNFPQVYAGVPVRHARLSAVLSHGNLVMIGTEAWADVNLKASPVLTAEQALETGFAFVSGRSSFDSVLKSPELEVAPFTRALAEGEASSDEAVGAGVGHYLTWKFAFQRAPDDQVWEMRVDARTGRVLAMEDTNQYVNRSIKGGAYPLTNTEVCPNNAQCGTMQANAPMPFADTGLVAPDNFANSAGIFNYSSGSATTTFTGKYVRLTDTCGTMSQSATGTLDLGGVNGNHDCTIPAGASAGNTAASRSGFYELNKLMEQGRGWLPGNAWLQAQLTSNMNLPQTCNAFYSSADGTVNFYKSGGGCRNTGEIAAVFDHEWGHALDDNDSGGVLSSSSEGYADIGAIYRLQASCVGHGFFQTVDNGCGMTADGTGFNVNESSPGFPVHCALDCSGVRDTDWDKHADHAPDTPQNFNCPNCSSGSGPCGRQVHCSAAPTRQAAWDFVARDLTAAPFSYDSQSAFIVGNKLFYQGSGNVGAWHSCACPSSADGCAAANGYMNWLAADDDNGNLTDGTPHMTALFAAYNRHNIACAAPAPVNAGCAAGPTGTSTLTVTAGVFQNSLSWTAVAGATRYWVFRSEGFAGCDFGKALIAEVTGSTVYVDTQVADGRTYYYNIVAAGASSACYSRVSNCANGTPFAGPDFVVSCAPASPAVWEGETGTSTCTVTSTDGFTGTVALACTGLPAGASCGFSPGSVTPPANSSAQSTLTLTLGAEPLRGSYPFSVSGTSGAVTRNGAVTLVVNGYGTDRHSRHDAGGTGTPRCFNYGRACDTGALVTGRDTITGGNEPNQPNTIGGTCADGTSGAFHIDESIDYVRVYSADGQIMAPGGQVKIEAKVWVTNFTQDAVDFYFAPDASAPVWALIGTVAPTANGLQTVSINHTLPAGVDVAVRTHLRRGGSAASCGAGSFDDHDDLVFKLGSPAVMAAYDATLKAPKCTLVGKSCDTGPALILGRDGKGPEPNQPNTINTSCADGTSGTFHSDESVDQLRIETLDGGPFAAGKTVKITATLWVWAGGPTSDHLELFSAPNAAAPVWTKIGTTITPTAGGVQNFTANYVLPGPGGGLQAIRARFRFQGSDSSCNAAPTYDDHDDLIFAVQ